MSKTLKKYKYPNCKKIYILESVEGYKYKFKCGHWCTDNVFEDLIDVKTNVQNFELNQLFK